MFRLTKMYSNLFVLCFCICFCEFGQGAEDIAQPLNRTLNESVAENKTKWTTLKPGTSDQQSPDLLGILQPLFQSFLPVLTGSGLTDPAKLLPMILSYMQSTGPDLEASGVSENCRKDSNLWYQGLTRSEGWAWKVIDSSFKVPSNLAGYNFKWLGDMEECMGISGNVYDNVTSNMRQIDGKFCRLIIPLGEIVAGASGSTMTLGTCFSKTCSDEDVKIIANTLLGTYASSLGLFGFASCIEDLPDIDSKAVVAICILGVIGTLVLIGTLYDVIAIQMTSRAKEELPPLLISSTPQESSPSHGAKDTMPCEHEDDAQYIVTSDEKHTFTVDERSDRKPPNNQNRMLGKILTAFSLYTNGCKLLNTSQRAGSLDAINGIRFLSMAWIILGHTYFFALSYTSNIVPYGKKKINQWTFTMISTASVSVDTFFALSGTLVAYLTLRELKKVGGAKKFNWFIFYFHRFWRLTPPYMLILMFGTVLYKYISFGPMKFGESIHMLNCKDSWWTNLLYINNFANLDKICMGWTWYLANDMQMYIISPLIVLPLFYNVYMGGIASLLFLVGTITATAVISHGHSYPVQSWSEYAPTKDENYHTKMYIPVSTRLGPYLVGLVTGYALYKCKCRIRIPLVVNLFSWFICMSIILLITYGPFTKDDSHIFSKAETDVYNTLSRLGWGVAVCWIIFACATGHGGWINELLSWKAFVPLGRLTYLAYLLHPFQMSHYYENLPHPIYFTDYVSINLFIGNLVMSYGLAFVASLFLEAPMMGLEKAVFKRK